MGADIVIAVDVGTPLEPRENLTSLVSITAQLSGLLVVRNANAQIATLTDRDVLISPQLGSDITSSSFDLVDKAIPIGYEGANCKARRARATGDQRRAVSVKTAPSSKGASARRRRSSS